MRLVEDEKKPSVSVDELLDLLQTKKGKESQHGPGQKSLVKGLPVATIILGLLIIALGAMVIILKSDIAALKNDISDLKNLKTQVATLDPKLQITTLEGKLEEMKKEKEAMKGGIAQLRDELEALKAERKKTRR